MTGKWTEYFVYLDELRESGEANMFGAGQHLREEFGLDKNEARTIAVAWMGTFDRSKSAGERALEAERAKS